MGQENNFIEEITTNSINILSTSQEYFDFLDSIKSHTMIEILFATLPCTILYNDIALELDSDMIHNNKIRSWINYYQNKDYSESVNRFFNLCIDLLDFNEGIDSENLLGLFKKACEMELLFFKYEENML